MDFIKDGKIVREGEGEKPIWLIDSVNMAMIMRGNEIPRGGSVVTTMTADRPWKAGEMITGADCANVRRWIVEKVQYTKDAVFVFMVEVKEVPSLMAGSRIETRVTRSDGRVEKLGNFRVPHDSVYADPDGLGQELLHEIARQDPLPIVKIIIVNVAD